MSLGTLLGNTFKFRLKGLWSCEMAAFDHNAPWSRPSSSPESMGKQPRLVTLVVQALWGICPQLGAFLLFSLAFSGCRKPQSGPFLAAALPTGVCRSPAPPCVLGTVSLLWAPAWGFCGSLTLCKQINAKMMTGKQGALLSAEHRRLIARLRARGEH